MGSFGRLTSLSDLPSDKKLAGYIKKAAELNDLGVRARKNVSKGKRPALKTPADLLAALKKNEKARATFEAFSPTNKRDYVEWITEAKTDDTRKKRLETSVAWMAEEKTR